MDHTLNPRVTPKVEDHGSRQIPKVVSMAKVPKVEKVAANMVERKAKEKVVMVAKVSQEAKAQGSPKASEVVAKAKDSMESALPADRQVTVPRIARPAA